MKKRLATAGAVLLIALCASGCRGFHHICQWNEQPVPTHHGFKCEKKPGL